MRNLLRNKTNQFGRFYLHSIIPFPPKCKQNVKVNRNENIFTLVLCVRKCRRVVVETIIDINWTNCQLGGSHQPSPASSSDMNIRGTWYKILCVIRDLFYFIINMEQYAIIIIIESWYGYRIMFIVITRLLSPTICVAGGVCQALPCCVVHLLSNPTRIEGHRQNGKHTWEKKKVLNF